MQFLVISQRARPNPNYSLKDLPGHGRFDIVIRCILAATRELHSDQGCMIYAYLKGQEPHGWLKIDPGMVKENDDEISLAARIKQKWHELFRQGSLEELITLLEEPFFLLSEDGTEENSIVGTVVLGAQQDLAEDDLTNTPIKSKISLGKRSLLASHAIIYTRQLNEFS